MLLFSTGSGAFNVEMRQYAIKNGYSLSQYDLKYTNETEVSETDYLSDINKKYPETEKDIFDFLSLQYIEPSRREAGTIKPL